tara:strand:+ start:177 stop:431 length:255 start_codon:yes stop_codon:yes gene_type:complete
MSSEWKLTLKSQSNSIKNTKVLRSSLITDCEIISDEESFEIVIIEQKAKDLRAMWNTRVRGLIAVDSLIDVIDYLNEKKSAQKM